MRMTKLTDVERRVLEAVAAEPDGWLNHFYSTITEAANGDFHLAQATCMNLRRRKLVDGEGRGKWAQYGINENGRAALAAS